jgi:hypothetical protein
VRRPGFSFSSTACGSDSRATGRRSVRGCSSCVYAKARGTGCTSRERSQVVLARVSEASMKAAAYKGSDHLKTQKEVVAYLNAALEDGEPAVLLEALRNGRPWRSSPAGRATRRWPRRSRPAGSGRPWDRPRPRRSKPWEGAGRRVRAGRTRAWGLEPHRGGAGRVVPPRRRPPRPPRTRRSRAGAAPLRGTPVAPPPGRPGGDSPPQRRLTRWVRRARGTRTATS